MTKTATSTPRNKYRQRHTHIAHNSQALITWINVTYTTTLWRHYEEMCIRDSSMGLYVLLVSRQRFRRWRARAIMCAFELKTNTMEGNTVLLVYVSIYIYIWNAFRLIGSASVGVWFVHVGRLLACRFVIMQARVAVVCGVTHTVVVWIIAGFRNSTAIYLSLIHI